LGAPTVFETLALENRDVVLVERNSLLADHLSIRHASQVHCADVREIGDRFAGREFDTVVLDPPWYVDSYETWLRVAVELVKPGARLLLPIFLPMIRPTGASDRQQVLDLLESIGTVRRIDMIEYDSPRFELDAMAAQGVVPLTRWRVAELVEVTVRTVIHGVATETSALDRWVYLRNGSIVIAIQKNGDKNGPITVQPVDNSGRYYPATVSSRYVDRDRVGLWTSRNARAAITGWARVEIYLRRVIEGERPCDAAPRIARSREELDAVRIIGVLASL
jgi:hypothetical protein